MVQDLFTKYGTLLKVVGVVFVGIHVPLVMAGTVWLGAGRSEPEALMLSVLTGTVAGLMISVAGIWSVFRSRGLVQP
jgi:hypothetical protein